METSYHKLQYLLRHESDWNNWLAYLLISSGSWQPPRPRRSGVQSTSQAGWQLLCHAQTRLLHNPRILVFVSVLVFRLFVKWEICLICHFILSFCPRLLEFTVSSFSKVICLSILKSDLCCTWKVKCGRWNWCLVGKWNTVIYGTVKCIMCNLQNYKSLSVCLF